MSEYDLTDHNYNVYLAMRKNCTEMIDGKRCMGEMRQEEPKITYWGHDDEPTKITIQYVRWCPMCHIVKGFERRFEEMIEEEFCEFAPYIPSHYAQ